MAGVDKVMKYTLIRVFLKIKIKNEEEEEEEESQGKKWEKKY